MRWFHTNLDRLHVALVQYVMPAVFRHGVSSPTLTAQMDAVQLPDLPSPLPAHLRLAATTAVGVLDTAYTVRLGSRPDLPVLVYHHGIAETPCDRSFRGIFRARTPWPAHLVFIRAPFHRSWRALMTGLSSMQQFLALCAVPLVLGETLRQALCARGAQGSLIVGTSLGGFLALVHHLVFGTASLYVPLLAGPDLAHVLLETHYRRLVAPQALACPAQIQARLDFRAALVASDTRRLAPLLARYDQTMLYAHHHACYTAGHVPVVTLERGHLSGVLAFTALRAHVQRCLAMVQTSLV